VKYFGIDLFLKAIEQTTIKSILKEDVSGYKTEANLPEQIYFINDKDRLFAYFCDNVGSVLNNPLQFDKRKRKFKTLSKRQFIKECSHECV
jgi:hypothetical protein